MRIIDYKNPLERMYDTFRGNSSIIEIDLLSENILPEPTPTKYRRYTPAGRKQVRTKLRRQMQEWLEAVEYGRRTA